MILNLATALLSVLRTGHVLNGERSRGHPCDMIFDAHHVLTGSDFSESHLTPVLTPAVPDDPVVLLGIRILAETCDGDDVIGLGGRGFVIENTTHVISERVGVNSCRHRSSGIDLRLDLVCPLRWIFKDVKYSTSNLTILGDGCIWEKIELDALAATIGESPAGAACVDGTAGGINVGAESFR